MLSLYHQIFNFKNKSIINAKFVGWGLYSNKYTDVGLLAQPKNLSLQESGFIKIRYKLFIYEILILMEKAG